MFGSVSVDFWQKTSVLVLVLVSTFAFVINANKMELSLEAVEVATFIAQKMSNDNMLEEAKFKA